MRIKNGAAKKIILGLVLVFSAGLKAEPTMQAPPGFAPIAPILLHVVRVECASGAQVNWQATVAIAQEIPFTDGFMIASLTSKNDCLQISSVITKKSVVGANNQTACPLGDTLQITYSRKL